MIKLRYIVLVLIIFGALFLWYDHNRLDETPNEQDSPPAEEETDIDPMNVLILGTDARSGMTGRTDTIMLLSYRPDAKELHLLSIPRDTRVLIKGAYDKINAAYVYGGTDLIRKTLEDFLDLEIDHHVTFNFEAFIKLIDLVEGVEVDVPFAMNNRAEDIHLTPGVQTLDGKQALGYVRYRGDAGGDLARANRQQQVVGLLADKMLSVRILPKLPQIIQTMTAYVEHDFSTTDILTLSKAAIKAKKRPIAAETLPGRNEKIDGIWYYLTDVQQLPQVTQGFK